MMFRVRIGSYGKGSQCGGSSELWFFAQDSIRGTSAMILANPTIASETTIPHL
jgi:hypothetical protein